MGCTDCTGLSREATEPNTENTFSSNAADFDDSKSKFHVVLYYDLTLSILLIIYIQKFLHSD